MNERFMHRTPNWLWLLLILQLFCQDAYAETYLFVGSNFPILSEETADGTPSGIATDVARIITTRLGHAIQIRIYPWERAKYMVRTGQADVLMCPYRTPEREQWLDFTQNYFFTDKTYFFVRADSKISWNGNFASLRGRRIGIVKGWSAGGAFDEAKGMLSIDYAPTLDICFKKLLSGRIDMIPTQVREANVAFLRLDLKNEEKPVIIHPPVDINHNYFGFTKQKDLEDFRNAFDTQLKKMNASGEIDALLKTKYGFLDEGR